MKLTSTSQKAQSVPTTKLNWLMLFWGEKMIFIVGTVQIRKYTASEKCRVS